ncbi:FCD domain-containing protein [Amycolatopsis sp. NPDC023774]|uniref:FCD domain-containing protein n=1 Tax=Amycolatopsis sp. NPDC023774 TaxID=3155015 RepID=UPI00340C60EC
MVGAHRLLLVTPRAGDPRPSVAAGKAHGAFHTALLEGCRNQRILPMAYRLRDKGELYRHWSVAEPDGERDFDAERRGLLDAVLARDAGLAADRLAAHLEATHEVLVKGL